MKLIATSVGSGDDSAPFDWHSAKETILGKLDFVAEYKSLGVRFDKETQNARGLIDCYALRKSGNQDEFPSAFINPRTGYYHDCGDGGETLGFFDFAVKHGKHGAYPDALKYYASRTNTPIPSRNGTVSKHKEAEYFYRDEKGNVRYTVTKWRESNGRKTFSQSTVAANGKVIFSVAGVEPLPYRLPDLLSRPDEPVFIVEGEKDCDRLAKLGFLATTNSQGASATDATWPRFAARFKDRICYIVPDNDAAGRIHARRVAGYLHSLASVVKIITLPGLGPKGDVSDWLEIGGTANELLDLAEKGEPYNPELSVEEEHDEERDATVTDIRRASNGNAWLWPLYIPSAAVSLLAAEGGCGKTRLCFDLHRRAYHGLPWPDGSPMARFDTPPKTLWVCADNQFQELIDLAQAFDIPDHCVLLNSKAGDPYSGTSLDSEDDYRNLEQRIRRSKPFLVFIDTIGNVSDRSLNTPEETKKLFKPLQEIAVSTGTPILAVTHLNAGGNVLGRRSVDKVRVCFNLDHPDKSLPNRRALWVSKSKAVKPPPLGVTMGDTGNEYDFTPPIKPPETKGRGGYGSVDKPQECPENVKEFLVGRLANGSQRVGQLLNDAVAEGLYPDSEKALRMYRYHAQLGIAQVEIDGRKFWQAENQEPVRESNDWDKF